MRENVGGLNLGSKTLFLAFCPKFKQIIFIVKKDRLWNKPEKTRYNFVLSLSTPKPKKKYFGAPN